MLHKREWHQQDVFWYITCACATTKEEDYTMADALVFSLLSSAYGK